MVTALISTGDYQIRAIEAVEFKSEVLDESGFAQLEVRLGSNSDRLTRCVYSGYGVNDIIEGIKASGVIDIDNESWEIYREFIAEVPYNEYQSLKENVDIANLIGAKGRNNDTDNKEDAWEELKGLDE